MSDRCWPSGQLLIAHQVAFPLFWIFFRLGSCDIRPCNKSALQQIGKEANKMLVLTRKQDESIVIDGQITIKVLYLRGNRIRLGIDAPESIAVRRGELPLLATNRLTEPASCLRETVIDGLPLDR